MAEHTYRLHWLDGQTQEVSGPDPATAMNNAGIGRGALRALDYYETVESRPDGADRLRAINAEMLAALERCVEVLGIQRDLGRGTMASNTALRNGEAAIAKARGEAS